MFLDSGPLGGPWGDPVPPACKSCRRPILADEPSEELRFPADLPGAEMSGPYHAACARPFHSIAHALSMLGRPFG